MNYIEQCVWYVNKYQTANLMSWKCQFKECSIVQCLSIHVRAVWSTLVLFFFICLLKHVVYFRVRKKFTSLKSVHFRNPHLFQNCCHFYWNQNKVSKNDNTFERDEDCTTIFLKWTDFSKFPKNHFGWNFDKFAQLLKPVFLISLR